MKLHLLRLWLLGGLLTGLLTGCKDSSDDLTPKPLRYRIAKAAETAYNLEMTLTYQYDIGGRLTTVTEYPAVDNLMKETPTAQATVYYETNTSNRLERTDKRFTKPYIDGDGLVAGTRRTFSYDSLGRLALVNESKALDDFKKFVPTQSFRYEYNSADSLPTKLIVSGVGPSQARNVYLYTFENGNAVSIKLSRTSAQTTVNDTTESAIRFDTAPNVYYRYFAVFPGVTSFNRNNVIGRDVTLFHDERGLLVKRVRRDFYADDVTTYTYEAY